MKGRFLKRSVRGEVQTSDLSLIVSRNCGEVQYEQKLCRTQYSLCIGSDVDKRILKSAI